MSRWGDGRTGGPRRLEWGVGDGGGEGSGDGSTRPPRTPGPAPRTLLAPRALDGPPGAWPARTHAPASVDAGATRLRKATERQDTAGGPRCERRCAIARDVGVSAVTRNEPDAKEHARGGGAAHSAQVSWKLKTAPTKIKPIDFKKSLGTNGETMSLPPGRLK
uniref:Uncharacterized protein n=1 Tax=Rousettus aegyptiacus TaxID=9407 RepID=A0A7J8FJ00_ROUAE|nr:hypothetical protein HJG63_012030 [Rousettus aegyptiacus]